ncbi:MAG: NYN domain-containing protein [Gammaproteobacteria bacterium]
MSFPLRYAILIDGGFLIHKIKERNRGTPPNADQVEAIAKAIAQHECVQGQTLLRTYFYHARPATGPLKNPISGETIELGATDIHAQSESLLATLELRADFALRLGETSTNEWKLGQKALRSLFRKPRPIEARDLVPNIEQKGVDLRIGLDIARLSLTQSVQSIVAVTGDSDLIPAFKFARREGLRIFLCHLDHGVKRDLKAHADRIVEVDLTQILGAQTRATAARKNGE